MLGLTFASFRAHLVPSHPFDVRCCVSSCASTCPFLGRWTIIPSLPACVLLTAPAAFVSSDALTSAIRTYPSDPTLPLSGLFCRPPSWSVVRPTRAHLPFACARAPFLHNACRRRSHLASVSSTQTHTLIPCIISLSILILVPLATISLRPRPIADPCRHPRIDCAYHAPASR